MTWLSVCSYIVVVAQFALAFGADPSHTSWTGSRVTSRRSSQPEREGRETARLEGLAADIHTKAINFQRLNKHMEIAKLLDLLSAIWKLPELRTIAL